MKIRSLLFAFILSVLFLCGGMATQAQTLDQTLSGCNGAAPLRTIQADPSNYRSKIAGADPGRPAPARRRHLHPRAFPSTTSMGSRASASSSRVPRPARPPCSPTATAGTS
jgi:hypothetical protein